VDPGLASGSIAESDIVDQIEAARIPELADQLRTSEGERYVKSCVKSARNYAWKNVPNSHAYIAKICELTNVRI
jgi:hypothetical protein